MDESYGWLAGFRLWSRGGHCLGTFVGSVRPFYCLADVFPSKQLLHQAMALGWWLVGSLCAWLGAGLYGAGLAPVVTFVRLTYICGVLDVGDFEPLHLLCMAFG